MSDWEIIPKHTRAAKEAIRLNDEMSGFSIQQVLSPGDWEVARLADGSVEVVINADGIRKFALMSPNQEVAAKFMDEFEAYLKNR